MFRTGLRFISLSLLGFRFWTTQRSPIMCPFVNHFVCIGPIVCFDRCFRSRAYVWAGTSVPIPDLPWKFSGLGGTLHLAGW
jgi:hypothetical protein